MQFRWFFLSFFICLQVKSAVICSDLFSTKIYVSDATILRLGYLPVEGHNVSGTVKDNLWTVSILRLLITGKSAWDFRFSSRDQISYFEFPLPREVLRKDAETQTTQNLSTPFLEFVYKEFTNELVKRNVFTKEFIESLKAEDKARLEQNFTLWSALNKEGEILATWGLYRHTEGDFNGKIELIRLASAKNSQFNISSILPFVTEYLLATQTTKGKIVVRTDRLAARLYRRFGAQEVGKYENGQKIILEISVQDFIQLYKAPLIENGSRPLRYVRFLDENLIF